MAYNGDEVYETKRGTGRHTACGYNYNEVNHKVYQAGGFTRAAVLSLLHLRCHNDGALVSSDLTNITSAVSLILLLYLLPPIVMQQPRNNITKHIAVVNGFNRGAF